MNTPEQLLARLDAIGAALDASGRALALIGLGSVGLERERLDAYSDLDFFVLARDGCKRWFLDDLGWLSGIAPLAFAFQNTVDGYKALYADGIFCEFAVFERAELDAIPFSPGRIVWQAADTADAAQLAVPKLQTPAAQPQSDAWLLGEALTNLYVGLGRYRRGEKLSAQRFIQHYAVDRALELLERREQPQPAPKDQFASERRYEQRCPQVAAHLPALIQGYERSRESALALLELLERHFPVPPAMAQAIRALC